MRSSWLVAGAMLLSSGWFGAANACLMDHPLNLDNIEYADAVVVGTIKDYRPVLGQHHAKFEVVPDNVLKGEVGEQLVVAWADSTFVLPTTMPPGAYLIALKNPDSQHSPPGGRSAKFLPNPRPDLYTVLQASCSDPFIFEAGSKEAELVKQRLAVSRP